MAVEPLRDDLRQAGAALLQVLDGLELAPSMAAWVYFHDLEEWRYYVATSLVDTIGKKRVYDLLLTAFDVIGAREGLTAADIHLVSTNDSIFYVIREFIDNMSSATGITNMGMVEITHCELDGVLIDAFVYRLDPVVPQPAQGRTLARKFERRVKELTKTQVPHGENTR